MSETLQIKGGGQTAALGEYTEVSSATAGSDLLAKVATRGMAALVGQDAALAAKYAQMEKQSANLEDINLALTVLNDIKAGTRETKLLGDKPIVLSDSEISKMRKLLGNDVTLPPLYKDCDDLSARLEKAICQDIAKQYTQFRDVPLSRIVYNTDINLKNTLTSKNPEYNSFWKTASEIVQAHKALLGSIDPAKKKIKDATPPQQLMPAEQAALGRLKANGISLTVPAAGKNFTGTEGLKALESLRTELSTAQTQQGQLNETLSLELNEIVGKRGAVLTQLQTILQSLVAARSQIARQM
jgi:hypothetical protein